MINGYYLINYYYLKIKKKMLKVFLSETVKSHYEALYKNILEHRFYDFYKSFKENHIKINHKSFAL